MAAVLHLTSKGESVMVRRHIAALLLVPSMVMFMAQSAAATEASNVAATSAPTVHLSVVTFDGQAELTLGRVGTSAKLSGTSTRCTLAGYNLVTRLRFVSHCVFAFDTGPGVLSSSCSGVWVGHEASLQFHNPVSGIPTRINFSTTTTIVEGSGSGAGRNPSMPWLHAYYQVVGLCPGAQDTLYGTFAGYVGAP